MNASLLVIGAILLAPAPEAVQTAAEYNAAGVVFYDAGRWEEAICAFEKAYESAPDNPTVLRNLCNAHQALASSLAKEKAFAPAVEHLELACAIAPENHSPLIQLGAYYLRLDMVPEAIYRLEEAIQLAPKNVDGHDLLGDAYYKDNDSISALRQWEWVLEVEPNRPGLVKKIEKALREAEVEQDFRPSSSRHFELTYAPNIPGRSLRKILDILERAYLELGIEFGRAYPPAPVHCIVYNAGEFADATQQGEHVGALYDGKIRIPLYDAAGNAITEEDLKRRLYHEYTHVLVRYLAEDTAPWWLNEGLAEFHSRELDERIEALLANAVKTGGLYALSDLEGSQLKRLDPQALRLAYAQSHATVSYLILRFGQRRLLSVLEDLDGGVEPEEALGDNYARDYASLEREIERRYAE